MTARPTNPVGYQIALTALLSLNFGFVLFDRNASSFLMPFIQPDLGLTNTQVGMISGALSLTWSLAAFGIGAVSDRTGSRKGLLVLATLAFSICSFGSGLAASFAMLLGARLLMGVAEGGIMPISQSLIASEVDARHRGLAMGVAQGLGSSLLGSFVAPVMLVAFAEAFGWRHAFFLAGAPGLIMALMLAWVIRAPSCGTGDHRQARIHGGVVARRARRAKRSAVLDSLDPARLLPRGLLGVHAALPDSRCEATTPLRWDG